MRIAYHQGGLQGADLLAFCADIPDLEIIKLATPEALVEMASSCEALILNSPLYTERLAQRLARPDSLVRWVQFASAGYETAVTHGVPPHVTVCNGGSVWGPTVSEHAVALTLGLLRALPQAERERAKARWDWRQMAPLLRSLEGATVGILGYGDIGAGVAARLKPFNAKVIGIARTPRALPNADEVRTLDEITEILPMLDVLVVSLPLSPKTRHIVSADWLARMKSTALLINVGRGPLIDEAALVEALRDGRIGGAGLDVAYSEPLAPDSPLWGFDNVLITPHIAALGGLAFDRLLDLCRENILSFQAGAPLRNQVRVG
jgi:phosphoglycerate dehydrogenase-like enzyme